MLFFKKGFEGMPQPFRRIRYRENHRKEKPSMTQNHTEKICAEEYTVKRGDSFYLIAHKLGVPLRDLLAANRDIHPARLMVGDVLCIPREEDDTPPAGTGSGGTGSTGGTTGSGSTGSTGGTTGSGGTGSTGGTTGSGSTGSTGGTTGSGNTGSTGGTTNSGSTGSTGGTTGSGSTGSTGGTTGSGSTGSTDDTEDETPAPSCPVEQRVQVEQGQTVADIQLKNLLSRHTLESANPGVNLDRLRTGQTLCVPTENVPCDVPETYTMGAGETLESLAVKFGLPVARLLRSNPCLAPQDFEAGTVVVLPRSGS